MKTIKLVMIIFGLFLQSQYIQAQSGKAWLEKIKKTGKSKVENKIDRKIDNTIDKAVDAPEKMINKKSKKNKENVEANGSSSSTAVTTDATSQAIGELIIKTNIKCREGKETLEELIREKNGVSSVSIDEKTGKVYLVLGDGFATLEDIETLIRNNGFEANGKKKIAGKANCN